MMPFNLVNVINQYQSYVYLGWFSCIKLIQESVHESALKAKIQSSNRSKFVTYRESMNLDLKPSEMYSQQDVTGYKWLSTIRLRLFPHNLHIARVIGPESHERDGCAPAGLFKLSTIFLALVQRQNLWGLSLISRLVYLISQIFFLKAHSFSVTFVFFVQRTALKHQFDSRAPYA